MSTSTTGTSDGAKSWFILHFEDNRCSHDFLVLSGPTEAIPAAISDLETCVIRRFGKTGNEYISSLTVVGPNSVVLQITIMQLLAYLRDLPPSPCPTKPDLWGLGSNRLIVSLHNKRSEAHR